MAEQPDSLEALNEALPLQDKLAAAHGSVRELFPFIARIAVKIYDAQTNTLQQYLHSGGGDEPVEDIDLGVSLQELLEKGRPRVISNPLTVEENGPEQNRRVGRSGYPASYTLPMFNRGEFIGLVFFNSDRKDAFDDHVLRQLSLYGHLISLMVIAELPASRTLAAVTKTIGKVAEAADPETGSHLDRMSRFARLIAENLKEKYRLNDSYIEHIYMFSPALDIGKLGIPKNILQKPGVLNEEEESLMRTHTEKGEAMINDLIYHFGLDKIQYKDVLRNIAAFHHEAVNGSGYPAGLKGDDIPLEARIVAVAHVFDALTSERPYRDAWSNRDATAELKRLAGERLDKDCVAALIGNMAEVERIQQEFDENTYI